MNMENKIFRKIDKILWTDWDPIGVNDIAVCRDEYRSYVPEIYRLKLEGNHQEVIAQKLFRIADKEIGIRLSMEFCMQVAGKIVEL
jgi:hypothetical protein